MDSCIHDCHCHLGVAAAPGDAARLAEAIRAESAARGPLSLHVMSTNHLDLAVLEELIASDRGRSVVPYFGIHPWYSHLFCTAEHVDKAQHYAACLSPAPDAQLLAALPPPMFVGHHMEWVRRLARQCAGAGARFGIGEIGLDKLFRVPRSGFYGNPTASGEAPLLGSRVTMAHQQQILAAQLQVALELAVPVSLHCVKAHGALFDAVTQGYGSISTVVLHSYSGSVDQARAWVARLRARRQRLAFSFSHAINGAAARRATLQQVVALLDDTQVVVESDLPVDEFFLRRGPEEYFHQLRQIAGAIGAAKNRTVPHQAAVMHAAALQL